jgi:ubiquinol-cytochrome c reductase cytochrome c subunit
MKRRRALRIASEMCFVLGVSATGFALAASDDVERGRALYVRDGCYECHGYAAQGALLTGPGLAPSPIPLPAIIAYVRAPKGQMPPYSARILPDRDVADIHAWLASVPLAPALEHIPLLRANDATDSQSPATSAASSSGDRGQALFAAHCAACHGTRGEGAIGPSLVGIGSARGSDAIADFVRNPTGNMPRLFPSTLSEQDVRDVSKYVAGLR